MQLADPHFAGGANDESLAAHQRQVLVTYPLGVNAVGRFRRDPAWRPVS